MRVFAYGSNLFLPRMRGRVPSARVEAVGWVRNRSLRFHKRSLDRSAKADARRVEDEQAVVWGVVYRIDPLHKRDLDRCESLGVGYDEEHVPVHVAAGEQLSAGMYVAREPAIDPTLKPYCWYLDYVRRGARGHGLPASYVDQLDALVAVRDPDHTRRRAHEVTLSENWHD